MFSTERSPRRIIAKYDDTRCTVCNEIIVKGSSAYWQSSQYSPTRRTRMWHKMCYEHAPETSTPGTTDKPVESGGNEAYNEEEYRPNTDGGAGGEMDDQSENGQSGSGKPLRTDLVCQMLFDKDKLNRHLHREDLYNTVKAGYSGYNLSQINKDGLIRRMVDYAENARMQEQADPEFKTYAALRAVERLERADDYLRELLKLPNRPDQQSSPEAVQNAMQQMQQAMEEMAEKARKAEEEAAQAMELAEEAEGKVVKVELPNGAEVDITDQHFKYAELVQLVAAGLPVIAVGPAGGGKTEAARSLARELGQDFVPISLGPQTTQASLFGYTDATGQYVRTPFREAFEKGGLILLDEFDRCNERVSVTLNAAIAQRYCSFPDGTVHAHEATKIIGAANTTGHGADRQYVSARQQDAATLDRFAVLDWPYDERFETMLALAQGLDKELTYNWLAKVRQVRERVQELGLRYLVSPRASIQGARLMATGASLKLAEDTILFRGWREEDKMKVAA